MNDMKRLLKYAGPYKKDMILGALLVLIETCFELFIPIMIADLIDVGVANYDLSYIYGKGVQMIFCALMALNSRPASSGAASPIRSSTSPLSSPAK